MINLKEINIINELVKRDLKKKYRGSILGILWTILNPLLTMLVMTIVFSNLFRFDISNYPLYLLSGQLVFNFFSESTTNAMNSLILNSPLIKKIYINKTLFPLSTLIFSSVNMFFSMLALFLIVIITNAKLSFTFMFIPVLFIYLFIFSYGIGLILSVVSVYFRDMMHLYSVFLMIIMYLTPLFYPISIIPDNLKWIINTNFLTYYVKYFRLIIYDLKYPDLKLNLLCLLISSTFFIIGNLIFSHFKNKIILNL